MRSLLPVTVGLLLWLPGAASGQEAASGDEPPAQPTLSARQVAEGENRARALLRDVHPRVSPPSVPYVRQPDQPVAKLEAEAGVVQWGNLFTPDETVALVNLAPVKVDEDDPEEAAAQYLYVFAWKDGRWTFRQYLGNVYQLSVHHRRDQPAAFLQGSRKTGRHDGDYLSWFYAPKSGQLVETKFEDWGPFYLVGDFLILGRGFERLAHDDTHWIYAYKDGKKGKLLAVMHTNDSGRFDIQCPDPKSGRMQLWSFRPMDDNGTHLAVTLTNDPKTDDAEGDSSQGQRLTATMDGADPSELFGFLTGLNPALLGDHWVDQPPKWSPPIRLSANVTGSRVIVHRLR